MTAKLISGTGLQLLRRYDHRPDNVQAALLDEVSRVFLIAVSFVDARQGHNSEHERRMI